MDQRAGSGPDAGNASYRRDITGGPVPHDVDGLGALDLPDMAFSMQDDLYIAVYSVWNDPATDAAHQTWVTERMRELEPAASGIQLADENLAARPYRFMAEANLRRLEALRTAYDPARLFHSYMAQPPS